MYQESYRERIPGSGSCLVFGVNHVSRNALENKTNRTISTGNRYQKVQAEDTEYVTIDAPATAMVDKKRGMNINVTFYNSEVELPRKVQRPQEKLETVAPIVELTDENESEVTFNEYIKIEVPHRLRKEELRYTDVIRCDATSYRHLPTGIENQDDHEDAYFTVDENKISIYTKSFSVYMCCKGHKDRLDLNQWVYCFYYPDSASLQIRVIISDTNPLSRLLNGRRINTGRLVQEESETVKLPIRYLSYKPKDVVIFVLHIEDNKWTSPVKPKVQPTNLSNIVDCTSCTKKDKIPTDAAVFGLELNNASNASTLFKGTVYTIIQSPESWFTSTVKQILWPFWPDYQTSALHETLQRHPDVKQLIDTIQTDPRHSVTSIPIRVNVGSSTEIVRNGDCAKLEAPDDEENKTEIPEDQSQAELTATHLLELSQQIATKENLRKLSISLGVKSNEVDTQLANHSKLNDAAHEILSQWRQTQSNPNIAILELCKALIASGMPSY